MYEILSDILVIIVWVLTMFAFMDWLKGANRNCQRDNQKKEGRGDDFPGIPATIVESIIAYGDARADGDIAQDAEWLATCMTAIREALPEGRS